jgi:hypothetical protein
VLRLRELRAGQGVVAVRVGDRLALQPDLLAGDRHGDGLLLGDDVLAQPRAARLPPLRPDPEALLRQGHRVVAGVAPPGRRGVVGRRAGARRRVVVPVPVLAPARVRAGAPGRPAGAGVVVGEPVVHVQPLLLVLRQVAVDVHPWRVLDLRLRVAHPQRVALGGRPPQRHERLRPPEQAGVHRHPVGFARPVVQVDLSHLADLVAGRVRDGPAREGLDLIQRQHLQLRSDGRHAVPLDSRSGAVRWRPLQGRRRAPATGRTGSRGSSGRPAGGADDGRPGRRAPVSPVEHRVHPGAVGRRRARRCRTAPHAPPRPAPPRPSVRCGGGTTTGPARVLVWPWTARPRVHQGERP